MSFNFQSNDVKLHNVTQGPLREKAKTKCPEFHGRVIHIPVSLVVTPLVDAVVSGEHAVSILKAKVTWSSQRRDDQTKDIARLHPHARYKERGQSEIREEFSDFSRPPPPSLFQSCHWPGTGSIYCTFNTVGCLDPFVFSINFYKIPSNLLMLLRNSQHYNKKPESN